MKVNNLKNDDKLKIITLCEFLFLDQYRDYARFLRFEKCFQPLFNNIDISIEDVFKDICGPKKKYLTYKRFTKAYLNHINGEDKIIDTKIFFDTLFNSILKTEKTIIGKTTENIYTFSTIKSCRKRECITMLQILSNKEGKILGINLEYDGFFKSKMYPKIIEDDLEISLEMNLVLVDENKENKGTNSKMKQDNYIDSITHIFGTINEETGYITFLGFKCISGKTVFDGFPEGRGFLLGKFGTKFHDLKIQMTEEGITKLEPGFKHNARKNVFLETILDQLSNDLEEEEFIKDEEEIKKLKNDEDIGKYITTSILDDNIFFNNKDIICGNDYKEVVDQHPRNWILKKDTIIGKVQNKMTLSLLDALKKYEKEYEIRALSKFQKKITEENIQANNEIKINNAKTIKAKKNENDDKKEFYNNFIIRNSLTFQPPINVGICLHKTKKLKPAIRNIKSSKTILSGIKLTQLHKKWNGIIDQRTTPNIFFNKDNYQGLKKKLGKIIHEEVMENNVDLVQHSILNEIVPCPGRYKKILKEKNNDKKLIKKRIH